MGDDAKVVEDPADDFTADSVAVEDEKQPALLFDDTGMTEVERVEWEARKAERERSQAERRKARAARAKHKGEGVVVVV